VAHRPLTTEELREALSVVPGDTTFNPARLLNELYSTLTCCGSLITIDEEELTVRLVHHSVKQFLLSGSDDSNGLPFTANIAHRKMTEIIVTYLNYGIFDTKLSAMVVPQIATASAPSRIISSTLDSSCNTRSLALKLLHSRKQPNFDIGKVLAGASKHFTPRSVDEFHFYSYAKSYCLYHAWYNLEQEPVVCNLLVELLKREVVDANSKDEYRRTPLGWAAMIGQEAVVKLLLDSGKVDISLEDESGLTPLLRATEKGHEAIIKLLLDSSKVDINSKDNNGRYTPLSLAIEEGHEAIIKLLLDSGKVDINSKDNNS
jgi:ankyrin repeat protein